jgi:fatty acid desaturase 2 (delta-6 desaturase)
MGKGGENVEKPKTTKKEVLIDGTFYDITDLKHPGGKVIDFYAGPGIDATQAFGQFHVRSAKAKKYMQSLPSRKADPKELKTEKGQEALLKDFDELTTQLIQEGYFKPSLAHSMYRIAEIIFLHVVGAYLVLHGQVILGLVILAIGQGRCGWLMHEGGHYSMFGNITMDRYLQIILYGVGCK